MLSSQSINYLNPRSSVVDEDGMDCLDNERRPHFPQFSYSASGREWTLCHGDIITAGLWGHQTGAKEPTALDQPRMTMTWRILPFCSSRLHLSGLLSFFIFVKHILEAKFHSNPAMQPTSCMVTSL